MATTATTLPADLGVEEGDIDVLLELLDERSPELSDELAAFLRRVLDPHGERTAPPGLYWPDATQGRVGCSDWAVRIRLPEDQRVTPPGVVPRRTSWPP
jgi:hypothetical protein